MDRQIDVAWNVMRRSRGIEVHGISNQNTCFNSGLSELISTVDLTSYNGSDHLRSMDLGLIVAARLKSEGRS